MLHKKDFITRELESRKKQNLFRQVRQVSSAQGQKIVLDGKELINLSSNDYLGLSQHPRVVEKSREYLEKHGTGSGASRLITGNRTYHEELEQKLADFSGTESALVFNSGFQANTTIIPALLNRESIIYSDKLNHNSIIQGCKLSGAKICRYRHNDMNHLEDFLKKHQQENKRGLIVSESVFSMDGDSAPLSELAALAEKYHALLMIDEAHGVGVQGPQGRGLTYGLDHVDIRLGTFGKAFGGFGAYVAVSKKIKEYLINTCSGVIYTTALPASVIGSAIAATELIPGMDDERRIISKHSELLRKELADLSLSTLASNSQIVPVVIGEEVETITLAHRFIERGYFLIAIRPPTVPANTSRLRITLHSSISSSNISDIMEIISTWRNH